MTSINHIAAKRPLHRIAQKDLQPVNFVRSFHQATSLRRRFIGYNEHRYFDRHLRNSDGTYFKQQEMASELSTPEKMRQDIGMLPHTLVAEAPLAWSILTNFSRLFLWFKIRFSQAYRHWEWRKDNYGLQFPLFHKANRQNYAPLRAPKRVIVQEAVRLYSDLMQAHVMKDGERLKQVACEGLFEDMKNRDLPTYPTASGLPTQVYRWEMTGPVAPTLKHRQLLETQYKYKNKPVVLQQAVVRIISQQKLQIGHVEDVSQWTVKSPRVSSNLMPGQRGAIGRQSDVPDRDLVIEESHVKWESDPKIKQQTDYVAIQRRIMNGEPGEWKIVSFLQPTSLDQFDAMSEERLLESMRRKGGGNDGQPTPA